MSRWIGAALGLGAGLSAVVGAGSYFAATNPAPKFGSSATRYDNSTFLGRYASFLSSMDPSTLLASDEEVLAAVRTLDEFKRGSADAIKLSNDELWAAQKLKDSAIHPDTGDLIPRPVRMAGYVPYNGPVCVGMMVAKSMPGLLFWSFVNQSQNALVNYFNRNASSTMSNETLAISYASAVSAALLVAFGVSSFIRRRYDTATAARLLKFVALPSSIVASSSNAYIMRRPEIASGIAVVDANGSEVLAGARSSAAASKAVRETVLSRVFLQVPTFFIPPMFMSLGPLSRAAAASPAADLSLNTFLTILGFGLGLPAAVGAFPQRGEIAVSDLEQGSELRLQCEKKGLQTVYYNKGL